MTFSDDIGDPLPLSTPAYVCRISFRRYRPYICPYVTKSPKKGFWGPWFIGFVGGRDTPDFGYAFLNYTYSRPRGRIWFSSVQRAHERRN